MSETNVKLIECFKTWQGEGPDVGRSMVLLRFKNCNLNCPWCDTKVKMRISSEATYELKDIQATIYDGNSGILLTGGEPTIEKHFQDSIKILNKLEYPIANVESNGFRLKELINSVIPTKNVHYIYSPKIFDPHDLEREMKATEEYLKTYYNVYVKVVYEDRFLLQNYLIFLSSIVNRNPALSGRVWLMPEGTSQDELFKNAPNVFDACEKYKFNFSSRSHIMYGFI